MVVSIEGETSPGDGQDPTVLADARLVSLTEIATGLGNDASFKAVDEVMSSLQTISAQAGIIIRLHQQAPTVCNSSTCTAPIGGIATCVGGHCITGTDAPSGLRASADCPGSSTGVYSAASVASGLAVPAVECNDHGLCVRFPAAACTGINTVGCAAVC